MSDLEQRLAYKKNLKYCLLELAHLTKKQPSESQLLPLNAKDGIRKEASQLQGKPCLKFRIDFEGKKSPRFSHFVERLYQSNPSPIYIWTELTDACGLFEIDSILEFDFGFSYDVNREGLILLLAKNMIDKMTLDFYENSQGQKILEVEITGDNWSTVIY